MGVCVSIMKYSCGQYFDISNSLHSNYGDSIFSSFWSSVDQIAEVGVLLGLRGLRDLFYLLLPCNFLFCCCALGSLITHTRYLLFELGHCHQCFDACAYIFVPGLPLLLGKY